MEKNKWILATLVRDTTNDSVKVYFNKRVIMSSNLFDDTRTVVAKEILVGNDRDCEGACLL